MDSNTTAGGDVPIQLRPDPSTASHLIANVLMGALLVCEIIGFVVSMAIVIKYFRGQQQQQRRRPGVEAAAPAAVDVELAQEPVLECTFRTADGREETTCSVCLSDMADGDKVRVLTACTHSFHATCVEHWLLENATCPLCRAPTGAAVAKDRRPSPTEDIGS